MGPKTDFHIHTTKSDGALTPTEIVKKFKNEEYDLIAITDHDGVDGVREAKIAGEALEITVVPGMELSTCLTLDKAAEFGMKLPGGRAHEGIFDDSARPDENGACGDLVKPDADGIVADATGQIGIHLLGYRFDIDHPEITRILKLIRQARHSRNEKLIELLNRMGYAMKYEDILAFHGGDYVGKPVIARYMVKQGYIEKPGDAFSDEIFESEQARQVPRAKMDVVSAIRLYNEAGGISVVAHPMKIKDIGERGSETFWENLDLLLKGLKKAGLKGLECFHSSHSHEEALRLVDLAEKYHLHITNGSDYHGDDMKH